MESISSPNSPSLAATIDRTLLKEFWQDILWNEDGEREFRSSAAMERWHPAKEAKHEGNALWSPANKCLSVIQLLSSSGEVQAYPHCTSEQRMSVKVAHTLSMRVMICSTSWSCRRSSPCLNRATYSLPSVVLNVNLQGIKALWKWTRVLVSVEAALHDAITSVMSRTRQTGGPYFCMILVGEGVWVHTNMTTITATTAMAERVTKRRPRDG